MEAGPQPVRLLGGNLALAAGYAVLAAAALIVTQASGLASPVWPAAGLAFALVYRFGWRLLPGVAVGSALNNAWTLWHDGRGVTTVAVVAIVIGIGSAAQAWAGRWLAQTFAGRHASFVKPSQIVTFLAVTGPLACLVNATVSTVVQGMADLVPQQAALQNWMTWWVGDALGVIIFGPITLLLLPGQGEVWRRRRLLVTLPAVAAAAAGIAVFLQGASLERDQRALERALSADSVVNQVTNEMTRITEMLNGMRGLFQASEAVDIDEFRRYTADALRRDSALQAVSWNPWLRRDDLSAFEQLQRTRQGLNGYQATERDASGNVRPVADRPNYVLVGYIEPLAANQRALGYDIASDPVRWTAIERAVSTGSLSITAPVDLIQETGQQKGMLILNPIFSTTFVPASEPARRADIRGFAVGVYRWGDLLATSFRDARWDHLRVAVTDVTDTPVLLAIHQSRLTGEAQPTVYRDLDVGGRTWRIAVTETSVYSAPQLVNSPIVMLLGLMLALLLMTFLLLVSGMEHQARMDAALDPLTGLHNRRALDTRLEMARRRAQTYGTQHVLLFIDLDGFKEVNDTAGHALGDTVLRDVAEVMRRAVREQDTVARIGGDEFALVLLDCSATRGLRIAQDIADAIAGQRHRHADAELGVTASVGLSAIAPPDPLDAAGLIAQADAACYAAKRAGGNRVRAFTDELDALGA